MYLYGEKQILVIEYLKEILDKKSLDKVQGVKVIEALQNYINANYNETTLKYEEFIKTLWDDNIKSIEDIFKDDKDESLKLLFGDENAQRFKSIWNRTTNYIYSRGGYRRSYRSKREPKLYVEKNIFKLIEFLYLVASDFSLDKYFENNKEDYEYIDVISDILAIEMDNNNQEILDKVKDVIYNDNNTTIVTRSIIKGLLMSENEEAHKMIGELLLAAKLQEGLRQAIVESLDEGSRKGFIYILKLIIDNNLMRFSSVSRAFCTWTGLSLDVEKPKVIKKCFEAAYNCLMDEKYKESCLSSDDNLIIYIGLWTVAFDEVEDIKDILKVFINGDIKYKKIIALEFLYETQFNELKHKFACEMLEENDLEVVALVIRNLFGDLNCYSLEYNKQLLDKYTSLGNSYYGLELFYKLQRIISIVPKKEIKYDGIVFPWTNVKLSINDVIDKLILSIGVTEENNIIDTLIDYKDKMSSTTREFFVKYFLKNPKNNKQKLSLIQACGDRVQDVRENAFKIINSIKLTSEDYYHIENLLKYKSGDLRKSAIKLVLKQSSLELANTIKNLAKSKEENKKLAAIDIVNAIEGNPNHKSIYNECLEYISAINDILLKDQLITKNIDKATKEIKNLKNGFGLYDPSKDYIAPKIKNKDFDIKSKLCSTEEEIIDIVNKFSDLINENRDFEYEVINWDDSKTSVTLGGSYYLQPFNRDGNSLDKYPLSNEIRQLAKVNNLTSWKLIELDFYIRTIHSIRYSSYIEWYEEFLEKNFNYKVIKKLSKSLDNIKYYEFIKTYISTLVDEIPKEEIFELSKSVAEYVYIKSTPEKHVEKYLKRQDGYYYSGNSHDYFSSASEINYWFVILHNNLEDDENFKEYFYIAYNYYKASNYHADAALEIYDFGRALELGIIDENEVLKELMERPNSPDNIRAVTNVHTYYREKNEKYKKLMELKDKTIEVISEIEANRGELDTEVTYLAANIEKCYGVNIFASIVLNSEKDTYVRGYNFIGGDCTKKQILSHLLKCCYPKEGENAQTLKEYLKDKKLSNKQLIEAAMYSPQWVDIVSEYLGYEGLKSVCWYFHAHVNDYFSDEKSAIVARYTPISTDDLKDGAFDQEWFIDGYNTIGEKKFKMVYDSAKYIAGGSLHKRSQLFADATLGKLKLNEIKNRVMDKRNKDYLLTYGLIPVKNEKDVLERYEYIQEFIKESKQFGAQRQASEGRSGNIALLNLARNAGFTDVNRLTWNMETAKIETMLSYLELKAIEDIEVKLVIDELGQAEVVCIKNGKELKNIPAKLKKNEYIVEINRLKKSLKDQYIRAKKSFENAMENGENFKGEELINLCKNPVLAPIIKNLLFKAGDFIGYLDNSVLVNYKKDTYKFKEKDDVIIAHPIHLYEAKVWQDYQKDIFSKKIVQPFKQVFRELYLPNSDELKEQTRSRRYAGHQVQPKKTLALLKTRGWIANNEEGLQKVYYKNNIIATIYAQADWFSPADMESPVIEFVRFEDRKTYKPLSLDKISNLIFSEVMRDLDLVVSVAHVGGVDPEASLSTVEIRTVIIEEILKLMKITNVKLKGSHAHIEGVHGEYTVHLGSGVVHKMGSGAINIVTVNSGHRGKIFLPFIDSDPRSAEIISKITLLAEDTKIKDPSILEQII